MYVVTFELIAIIIGCIFGVIIIGCCISRAFMDCRNNNNYIIPIQNSIENIKTIEMGKTGFIVINPDKLTDNIPSENENNIIIIAIKD